MDLIGGPPFAVIESDPGVFTSLTRRLGVKNLALIEIYSIEPWAIEHLQPHGLIFCFHWRKDNHRTAEFENPEHVWFANQVSDDACATHAILNVLLNCPSLNLGENLQLFKDETKEMSPVMKGLAITNSSFIRDAHNSLARQADLRGSLNAISSTTLDAQKTKVKKAQQEQCKNKKTTTPRKPKPKTPVKSKTKQPTESSKDTSEEEEVYHFIGYVPAFGKVWELDGLKPGPLEVGELESENTTSGWMDVARPALRMKMAKYGGGAEAANIRFSLLALVDGSYEKANDEWEYWKRERRVLERRMDETDANWKSKVQQELLIVAEHAFNLPEAPGRMFLQGGAQRLARDAEILTAASGTLLRQWEDAVRQAIRTKVVVEDEIQRATNDCTDRIKRTHDYEPFIVEYVNRLHKDGLLDTLFDKGKALKKAKSSERKTEDMEKKTAKTEVSYLEVNEDIDQEELEKDDDEWMPPSSRRR
ncbi:hypothetical protein BDP27DRAFT_1389862 [Rhodocollybia butyracea]|uniref:ubiquitinyl hydrolase 1 n=1 Tax=Rhodocollybia butyracea TaxID=206335 RepID=A0A9P5Q5N4_9AGAR|nr:hypothetical protein BDP27DRAFT_1389862 [Rhodocollybia butyracea]